MYQIAESESECSDRNPRENDCAPPWTEGLALQHRWTRRRLVFGRFAACQLRVAPVAGIAGAGPEVVGLRPPAAPHDEGHEAQRREAAPGQHEGHAGLPPLGHSGGGVGRGRWGGVAAGDPVGDGRPGWAAGGGKGAPSSVKSYPPREPTRHLVKPQNPSILGHFRLLGHFGPFFFDLWVGVHNFLKK